MKVEHVETRRTTFTAPEPEYTTEMWGPEGRKWEMKRLVNNPYQGFTKIEGKTFQDGVFLGKWVKYID
jgi:hypothetical protein